ncbi:hypothetical protein Tco_1134781 [Tanacetum coccineum]
MKDGAVKITGLQRLETSGGDNESGSTATTIFIGNDMLFISHVVSCTYCNGVCLHIWTCYGLYKEDKDVTDTRLHFLASQIDVQISKKFTVLVRNVPAHPDESVNEQVEHFFLVNHPDQYLQTGHIKSDTPSDNVISF